MKHRRAWITAGFVVIAIGIHSPSASAQGVPIQTTPPFIAPQDAKAVPTQPNNGAIVATPQQTNQQSQDFISQTLGFVKDIPQEFGQLLQSAVGSFKAPDLGQIISTFLRGSTSQSDSGKLAESLENKLGGSGSYSIRNDLSNESFRSLSLGSTNEATLSRQAQERASQTMKSTQTATDEIVSLGDESQHLDVTQQILQNIAAQGSHTGKVNKVLVDEAQQARVDRAMNNSLTAQIAEETAGTNISNRRETSAAANSAVRQSGSMMLFGGGTLGSQATP